MIGGLIILDSLEVFCLQAIYTIFTILQLHLHIFRNVIQSTYISKCDLQFCKSRQCFVLKQVQYYKYCFCIFSLSFLIFWGQGFVEVPQLLKSVSSFTYRIVNLILRFVSRYVSNRGNMYRYTPTFQGHLCSNH